MGNSREVYNLNYHWLLWQLRDSIGRCKNWQSKIVLHNSCLFKEILYGKFM